MYTLSPKTIKDADALAVSKYGISELTLMKNAAKSWAITKWPTTMPAANGSNRNNGIANGFLSNQSAAGCVTHPAAFVM